MRFVSVVLLTTVLLSGCATPQVPLTKQVQSNIGNMNGILVIPQNNLDVTVQATNPGNTGLIGVLVAAAIDSARRNNAQKAATPLLEPLRDYDFRAVMQDSSNNAISKLNTLKLAAPVQIEQIDSGSRKRIDYDQSSASAVLFCNIRYRLESGDLIVTAIAEMFPKATSLMQYRSKPSDSDPLSEGNAIYRKTFMFSKQAVTPENIKEGLNEAANSIAVQLADDLDHAI